MITSETKALLESAKCRPALIMRDHSTGKTIRYPFIPVSEEDVEGTTLVRVSFELSEVGEEITQNA